MILKSKFRFVNPFNGGVVIAINLLYSSLLHNCFHRRKGAQRDIKGKKCVSVSV